MTDKVNKKLTKRGFYVIVTLTYVIIAIISLTLFCLKFDITTILSFLGVTVSPSAPAFLAIFLSQYSAQAEDIQKGERLKDIQIKKEVSIALINHYKVVKKELTELPNKMGNFMQSYQPYNIPLNRLDMSLINKPFPVCVEKAMLHFIGETSFNYPNFLDDFKKSESKVNNINEKIDTLQNNVLIFLKKNIQKGAINVTSSIRQKTNSPNEIFGEEVFRAVYNIWNDEDEFLKTISSLENGITGSIPSSHASFKCIDIEQQSILFKNCLKLAHSNLIWMF